MAFKFQRDRFEGFGSSSAVSSVFFVRGDSYHQETKQGSYVYWGDAGNYHEWEFRTRLRVQGQKGNKYFEAVTKVVD
eukprot:4600492-Karenia_brevis.AAC.1